VHVKRMVLGNFPVSGSVFWQSDYRFCRCKILTFLSPRVKYTRVVPTASISETYPICIKRRYSNDNAVGCLDRSCGRWRSWCSRGLDLNLLRQCTLKVRFANHQHGSKNTLKYHRMCITWMIDIKWNLNVFSILNWIIWKTSDVIEIEALRTKTTLVK
jgi:hypothetical protein